MDVLIVVLKVGGSSVAGVHVWAARCGTAALWLVSKNAHVTRCYPSLSGVNTAASSQQQSHSTRHTPHGPPSPLALPEPLGGCIDRCMLTASEPPYFHSSRFHDSKHQTLDVNKAPAPHISPTTTLTKAIPPHASFIRLHLLHTRSFDCVLSSLPVHWACLAEKQILIRPHNQFCTTATQWRSSQTVGRGQTPSDLPRGHPRRAFTRLIPTTFRTMSRNNININKRRNHSHPSTNLNRTSIQHTNR